MTGTKQIIALAAMSWGLALQALPDPTKISFSTEWPLGLDATFEVSQPNLLTPEIAALGRRLFFDKRLSRDQTLSCATCHDPAKGFSNGEKVALGVGGAVGTHNVPSILNRLMGRSQFWDGRATSLEEQALGPLLSPNEMAMDPDMVISRLSEDSEYRQSFAKNFESGLNLENIARAIATFERTVLTGNTPFDRYEWGGDKTALSSAAIRGMALFRGAAGCSTCHTGTNFTDEKFHNLGVGGEAMPEDQGRYKVTGLATDRGAFKTPTLRNLSSTAPYMHDGHLATLAEVIDFYDRGGLPNANLDPEIKPLDLTADQKTDLLAFLQSLDGPITYLDPRAITEYLP